LTSGHSDAQPWASECPDVKNYKWRLNPVWHRMLYSCTHVAAVGVKGLTSRQVGFGSVICRSCIFKVDRLTHWVVKPSFAADNSHHFTPRIRYRYVY